MNTENSKKGRFPFLQVLGLLVSLILIITLFGVGLNNLRKPTNLKLDERLEVAEFKKKELILSLKPDFYDVSISPVVAQREFDQSVEDLRRDVLKLKPEEVPVKIKRFLDESPRYHLVK